MQGSLVGAVRITGPCSERCRARNRYERIRMAGNLQTISRKVAEAIVEVDKNIRIAGRRWFSRTLKRFPNPWRTVG